MLSADILKYRSQIFYGLILGAVMFLLNWLQLKFVLFSHSLEIYVGAIAIIFTSLGIWLAAKLIQPKVETIIVEKYLYTDANVPFSFNEPAFTQLGLSKRELEVLEGMAKGLSNQQIAGELFLSLNTIKTHAAKLFEKMDVQRRTQAVEKAKRLRLIP